MTPAVRAAAANVIFARPERAAAFLDAVEAGKIKAADVDRGRLKTLAAGDDAALRERAKKLLAAGSNAARQEVFDVVPPRPVAGGRRGAGQGGVREDLRRVPPRRTTSARRSGRTSRR